MVYTFQDMIQGCRRRDPRAWREFVTTYLPLARHFMPQYFPQLSGDAERLLPGVFAGMLDDDGHFFGSFTGRAEREFMVHFRRYMLERGRVLAGLPAPTAPPVTLEVLEAALKESSGLQRQVVWLFMLGYSLDRVAPILNMKEETAAKIIQTTQEGLRAAMDSWSQDSLSSSRPVLVEAVSSRESQDCYPYLGVSPHCRRPDQLAGTRTDSPTSRRLFLLRGPLLHLPGSRVFFTEVAPGVRGRD